MIYIRVSGLAALERMLDTLGETAMQALEEGLRQEAEDIVATAQMFTPLGPTGRLRTGIKVKQAGRAGKKFLVVVGTEGVPYAAVQHWTPRPGAGAARVARRRVKGRLVLQSIKGYRHKPPTTRKFLSRGAAKVAEGMAGRLRQRVGDAIDRQGG